jgi:hypothetical protein
MIFLLVLMAAVAIVHTYRLVRRDSVGRRR